MNDPGEGWRPDGHGNWWKQTEAGLVGFNERAAARLRASDLGEEPTPLPETTRLRLEDGTVLWERGQ